ncbi:hypothetical protein NP233_g9333 [Leucocoprinus birnbaumii]|uniref:XRRM domain-containing protein n=1 Tax=Leucocoprinus birnbaumii TaxID=56174 RepID=A0AAD5VMB5_9AGAR|nr:hypothetical protein NP233_g9333 [Leucocoprinus birnbaumii]
MSSLSFLPRKLTKGANASRIRPLTTGTDRPAVSTPSLATPSTSAVTLVGPVTSDDVQVKHDDQDYASLIALALSDFTLWLDAELRQRLGPGSTSGPDAGFVSLNYLLEHSPPLISLLDGKPGKESKATRSKVQAALAKAVKSTANHLFDVRLLLHADETVPRFGKQKEVIGGYEIRKKRVGFSLKSKSEWDACTLYIENIPPGHRTYSEIIRFLNDLLRDAPPTPSPSHSIDPLTRIQGITFPSHHNDKPDTRPSCKGFALVTFARVSDCQHLEEHWPWTRGSSADSSEVGPSAIDDDDAKNTAAKTSHLPRQYHFRIITKVRWLQLKAEYLTHRQKLVDEMNAYQDAQHKRPSKALSPQTPDVMSANASQPSASASAPRRSVETSTPALSPYSPFPPNCLVFVKNVHPETTKTTLRGLLSRGLGAQAVQSSQKNHDGLDYVDFSKGMDTCYLRLATPAYTTALVEHFDHRTRKIVQVTGMDEAGIDVSSEPSSFAGRKPIVVERVIGRPEEIYWEKVPVKVKKGAVEKAIQLTRMGDQGEVGGPSNGRKHSLGVDTGREESSRKKKRKL